MEIEDFATPNHITSRSRSAVKGRILTLAVLAASPVAGAANLVTFDADPATAGNQNGSASWLNATGVGTTNWTDNTSGANITWASTKTDRWSATLGGSTATGTPGTVDVGLDRAIIYAANVAVNGDAWFLGTTTASNIRGSIDVTGTLAFNGTATDKASATTLNLAVQGTGGLTVNGRLITISFRGSLSTYSGPTTLNGGIDVASGLSNAGGSTSSNLGTPATAAATGLVFNGGTLRVVSTYETADTVSTTNRLFTLGTLGGTIDASSVNTADTSLTSRGTVKFTGTGALAYAGTGSRTLTLTGTNTTQVNSLAPIIGDGTGGATSILKNGSATWQLSGSNTYTGTTTVAGGTLRVTTAASGPILTGAGGADVQGGTLVLDYTGGTTPVTALQARLFSGAIHSSTGSATRGLGYKDDGTSQITVVPTLYGDADLHFGVSINDFNLLAANFGQTGKVWADGDFDYDGGVSINDFNLLAANFGKTLATASDGPNVAAASLWNFAVEHNDVAAFEAATGVPEPTTLGLLTIGGILALKRRRQV